jgi:pimeloyl-ACP methyl ester carboxylesterase
VEHLFDSSGGVGIWGHLARPRSAPSTWTPGLVIGHGFPAGREGGRLSARSFPELADRIATELGWVVLVVTLRGCGDSQGNFSMGGWRDDLAAASAYLRGLGGVDDVWLVGFGTGGALAICAAGEDPEVRGVAALASPADFDDWSSHPRRLLLHAREVGIIRSPSFPESFDQWSRELKEIRAVAAAPKMRPRPLLIVHGSDDESVPVFDARVLADAHGDADLRIIDGAGHQLRHDPRAVAVLLGWLDRQRNLAASAAR